MWNDKQYRRYREAFIAELNGQKHEFSGIAGVTKDVLGRTQDDQNDSGIMRLPLQPEFIC